MDESKKENVKVIIAYLVSAIALVIIEYYFLNFGIHTIIKHFIFLTLAFNMLFIFKFVANPKRSNLNLPMVVCLFLFGLLTFNSWVETGEISNSNYAVFGFILVYIIYDFYQTHKAKKLLEENKD